MYSVVIIFLLISAIFVEGEGYRRRYFPGIRSRGRYVYERSVRPVPVTRTMIIVVQRMMELEPFINIDTKARTLHFVYKNSLHLHLMKWSKNYIDAHIEYKWSGDLRAKETMKNIERGYIISTYRVPLKDRRTV